MCRMAFRLCRSPGAQVTSLTLLVVLQRRGIGLQGGRLKEGKPPFPAVIISYVPSYVNAVAGSWVREERSVRSGRARPQRAVHRLQAPLAPPGPQPTDGAFLCAVYPSSKKDASVWRSPSRDAGLNNGPNVSYRGSEPFFCCPLAAAGWTAAIPERYQMNRSSGVSERR